MVNILNSSLSSQLKMFKLLLFVSVAFILIFAFYRFPQINLYEPVKFTPVSKPPFRTNVTLRKGTKTILYWTSMLSSTTWFYSEMGYDLFKSCKFTNCFVTNDHEFIPVETFDAILFYTPRSSFTYYPTDLPQKRSPHQRYVFANRETPLTFNRTVNRFVLKNFYNWTMTYRFDSDLTRRLGRVIDKPIARQKVPSEEFVRKKDRSVAWFVSRCDSRSNRHVIAEKLQKYIDVDIYGKCGTLTCSHDDPGKCYTMVEEKYKFYLSFENSICKDYTTEKLYNILQRRIIPVVYGGGDYSAPEVAPPHSVINVLDFESIESLANYLKDVANNVTRYLEYFEWKKSMSVARTDRSACELCRLLNDPKQPEKVYEDIEQWWFSKEKSGCRSGEDLPEILNT